MRNDDAALRAERGQSAGHGFIIGEETIAVQFDPVSKTALDIIERKWPLHVSGDLHSLPRSQVAVNLSAGLTNLRFNRLDRRFKIDVMLVGMCLQIRQAPLQLEDWFFEIERLYFHVEKLQRYKVTILQMVQRKPSIAR